MGPSRADTRPTRVDMDRASADKAAIRFDKGVQRQQQTQTDTMKRYSAKVSGVARFERKHGRSQVNVARKKPKTINKIARSKNLSKAQDKRFQSNLEISEAIP